MNSHNRDQEPIPALRLHRFGDIFSPSCYNIVFFSICALLLSTSKNGNRDGGDSNADNFLENKLNALANGGQFSISYDITIP